MLWTFLISFSSLFFYLNTHWSFEPQIILVASLNPAFKSFIFSLAIALLVSLLLICNNPPGSLEPLFNCSLPNKMRSRWRFNYKIKLFIFVNCYYYWDRLPHKTLVFSLKALQNSIILIPLWPSAGPTGGAGFACHLLFVILHTLQFLLHLIFSTWLNSKSTGVALPNIETDTLSLDFSSSISSSNPLKEANGPSHTLTFSPISKDIPDFWLTALSKPVLRYV